MKRTIVQAPVRAADGILDRIAVIVGALFGAQVPGFISHYRQRLGGRLDEARANVAEWQANADAHYGGSLDALVQDYQNNPSPSVVDTGEKVVMDLDRVDALQQATTALDNADAWHLPAVFVEHFDYGLAASTLQDYVLNVPTDAAGLGYAAVGALLGGMCYHGGKGATRRGARSLVRRKSARRSGGGGATRKKAVDQRSS